MIDVATLTGAVTVALGDYTGVFTTTNELWNKFESASNSCGEMSWRLPLLTDFASGLKSDVADLMNLNSGAGGGSSIAAAFLKEFVEVDNWIHLDIAGSSRIKKKMTGRTTKSLINFSKIIEDELKK